MNNDNDVILDMGLLSPLQWVPTAHKDITL